MDAKTKDIYTPIQKANVVLWFAESGNVESVQNLFYKNYFNKNTPVPDKHLIFEWLNTFRDTGFVDERKCPYRMLDEATEMNSCPVPYLEVIGGAEGGKVVEADGEDRRKKNEDGPKVFHPYIMFLTKKLYIEDAQERVKFAAKELTRLRQNPDLLQTIWFTGEASFYLDNYVHVHNLRYASKNQLEEPHPDHLASSKHITVWAALNLHDILGPYFFEGDVNSYSYETTLREFFYEVRQHIAAQEKPVFMHDDSPIHRKFNVREFLESEVPHQWIGSGSDYANWPHHSPDISPMNYFLWGFIKSQVYKTKVDNLEELRHRINVAFKMVTKEMLEEAVKDFRVRLIRLIREDGRLVGTCVNVKGEVLPCLKTNRSSHTFRTTEDEIDLDD